MAGIIFFTSLSHIFVSGVFFKSFDYRFFFGLLRNNHLKKKEENSQPTKPVVLGEICSEKFRKSLNKTLAQESLFK